MRMPASAWSAYGCSVCYVRYEAAPENLAAPMTACDSHSSVTWNRKSSDESLLFSEADIVVLLFPFGNLLRKEVRLLIS